MSGGARAALALVVGGAVALLVLAVLRAHPPGGASTWTRLNYRGRAVHLGAGPALVLGGAAGALAGAGTWRAGVAAAAAGLIAGSVGVYDDLAGTAAAKGLRGHLTELLRGRPTSGALKIPVLGLAGLIAGVVVHGWSGRAVLDAAFVAGAANLVNLLDLRPGRAAKALLVGVASCLAVGATAAAGPGGAVLSLLPADLRERVMVGDAGANGAGAAVAATALAAIRLPTLLIGLAIVVALTLLSEWISFSRVIERVRPLRWLDGLGRTA